jgi:hypothetical protein
MTEMAATIWRKSMLAAVVATGGLLAASTTGAHATVPNPPAAPTPPSATQCPLGDWALPSDADYYTRTEEFKGDEDIDTMTMAGHFKQGTCFKFTGDRDSGKWAKGDKGYTKDTNARGKSSKDDTEEDSFEEISPVSDEADRSGTMKSSIYLLNIL